MKVSKIPGLGRFGVYIDNVDMATISDEEWMEIGKLHLNTLVTIIRDSNCTKDRLSEMILKFGDTRYGGRSFLLKKYGVSFDKLYSLAINDSSMIDHYDKNMILSLTDTQVKTSNNKDVSRVSGGYHPNGRPKGLFSEGELGWHSNESGTLTWSPGVALVGEANTIGSATCFISTPDYYENVSERFRSELNEMIIEHKYTYGKITPGLNPQQDAVMRLNMCPVDGVEIPLVIKSPGGITGLHYPINTVYKVKGMTESDSNKVFDEISKNLFVDKYIYEHWYKNNNDLCLFDNSITLHKRLGQIDGRVAYRMAYDYTNLQDDVYQPFFQKKYQKRYNNEIRETVKALGIKNFKLPPKTISDYIPW